MNELVNVIISPLILSSILILILPVLESMVKITTSDSVHPSNGRIVTEGVSSLYEAKIKEGIKNYAKLDG